MQEQTRRRIDRIFHTLPAGSYQEIADKYKKQTGEWISYSQVDSALQALRKSPPERFGWTILHCKRGPYKPGKLFAVIVDPTGKRHLTESEMISINEGAIGSASYVNTMLSNAARGTEVIITQAPTLAAQRFYRALLRDIKYLSDMAGDMKDDFRDAK